MVKNREINGTEEIGLVTPTPGTQSLTEDVFGDWTSRITITSSRGQWGKETYSMTYFFSSMA